jgi:hypothetical protein
VAYTRQDKQKIISDLIAISAKADQLLDEVNGARQKLALAQLDGMTFEQDDFGGNAASLTPTDVAAFEATVDALTAFLSAAEDAEQVPALHMRVLLRFAACQR